MKKFVIITVISLMVLVTGGLVWGVNYLFNYAVVRGDKDFIKGSDASGSFGSDYREWTFATNPPEMINQQTSDGLELTAAHFKQKQTKKPKLAIIAHGYTSYGAQMNEFSEVFYEMGFDLLVPDARGHGESEGKYMGFGWPDRIDYVNWIKQMTDYYGKDVEILLYGVSMGGATVMMTAGEKLPPNVKLVIEDCGYDVVENELKHQLKEMFNLPAFPLIPLTSVYSGYKAGYNFKEASSVAQLKKNKLPMLFIHGGQDDFVPTEMVYQNYEATQGPKELLIVEEAKHAQSYKKEPEKYEQTVKDFIATYMTN